MILSTIRSINIKKLIVHVVICVLMVHIYLHATNPYASFNMVQQLYTTSIVDGKIYINNHFNVKVHDSKLADYIGYYKSGFLITQNTFLPYPKPSKNNPQAVIDDIHRLRFDPDKPYLISGNQFSVLYVRNLGVFYNSLLDPSTARSQQDWENRQRIYLHSALYALDAFSAAGDIKTTIVPLSPHSVALTQVHPGSIASDSLYGLFYALDKLATPNTSGQYSVQTVEATERLLKNRHQDIANLVSTYIKQVQDPDTKLIKRHIDLASARDGITRDSSFYDNIVLWKTLSLAQKFGATSQSEQDIASLKQKILDTYWDERQGIFCDEYPEVARQCEFSSDWLLANPTGFLDINNQSDQTKLKRIIDYTRTHKLAEPLPISYSVDAEPKDVPFFVKKAVPTYGGDAIWSYWGAEYMTLLGNMHGLTGDVSYRNDLAKYIAEYDKKIVQYGGYPETFDKQGNMLRTGFYKSILETGWVVQYEKALTLYDPDQ